MKNGFSLVELSIVLVILGLLTGGILGGQALIRAAELRAVSTEYERFATARSTFRDKYFALPGDMPNATAFWGIADGGDGLGADCEAVVSTTPSTCNGNGDGIITSWTSANEAFRYWQHLANAGFIEGQYTGAPNGTMAADARYASRGRNVPASKLGQAAWYTEWVGSVNAVHPWAWEGDYGNPFFFGNLEPTDITEVPALTPAEAWNIDMKVDDGRPAQGRMRTYKTLPTCNSNASAATAEYLLSSNSIACYVLMIPGG